MYNVAIIGCGRISHKIAEGVAKNNDRMKLVVLCDPVEEKMFETEKTYNKKMGIVLKYKIIPLTLLFLIFYFFNVFPI